MYFTEIGHSVLKSLGDVLKSPLKSSSHGLKMGYRNAGLYGGVRSKNFCYEQIPEFWRDFGTHPRIWMWSLTSVYNNIRKLWIIPSLGFPRITSNIIPYSKNCSLKIHPFPRIFVPKTTHN